MLMYGQGKKTNGFFFLSTDAGGITGIVECDKWGRNEK